VCRRLTNPEEIARATWMPTVARSSPMSRAISAWLIPGRVASSASTPIRFGVISPRPTSAKLVMKQ